MHAGARVVGFEGAPWRLIKHDSKYILCHHPHARMAGKGRYFPTYFLTSFYAIDLAECQEYTS